MHGNNRKSEKHGLRSIDIPQAFRCLRPARVCRAGAVLCLGLALSFAPGAVSAGDGSLQFLQALRENGYGDMAVEYLRILDKAARSAEGSPRPYGIWRCRGAFRRRRPTPTTPENTSV